MRASAKEQAKAKGISAASASIPASALVPLQESALPKEEEHMAKPSALSQEKDSETEENAEFANKRYGTHFTGDPLELWKNPKGKDKAISARYVQQLTYGRR